MFDVPIRLIATEGLSDEVFDLCTNLKVNIECDRELTRQISMKLNLEHCINKI